MDRAARRRRQGRTGRDAVAKGYRRRGVQDWKWTAPMSKEPLPEIGARNGEGAELYDYGLCGGAVVRASALASLPDDLPEEEMRSLQKMDDGFGMWNDVTLSALLMLGGHALEPWDDDQARYPSRHAATAWLCAQRQTVVRRAHGRGGQEAVQAAG